MQVQVEVFPDRLSIRNPGGGLHGPVEISSLGERTTTSTRNQSLLKIMEDTALDGSERMVCENRGTGIARMRRILSEVGMERPAFRDNISTFEVDFPNHTLLDQEALDWLHHLDGRPLTRAQMTLLAAMRNDRWLPATNSGFRELTAVQDSRVATRELGELVSRGLLILDGSRGRATYWLPGRPSDDADPVLVEFDDEVAGEVHGRCQSNRRKSWPCSTPVRSPGRRSRTCSRWIRAESRALCEHCGTVAWSSSSGSNGRGPRHADVGELKRRRFVLDSEARLLSWLRRQDSNLNHLNQNQRCCLYTTADRPPS
jgi:Putative ATP-dependent DNA helicase recG C-terminal